MKKYHYVYRITHLVEGKHYYGVRSSNVHPSKDIGIKYFSSSTNKEFINEQKKNPQNFKYKVVRIYPDRERAALLEINLHAKFNVSHNESFINLAKACAVGMGAVNVYEQWANYTEEQYQKHCESLRAGNKRYYDSLSEEEKKIHNDRLRKWKLKNPDKVKEGNKRAAESRKGSNNGAARRINIFNAEGELMFECHGNFGNTCREHGIPHHKLKESLSRGGEPIYQSAYGQLIAKKYGTDKYIGWFAKYNEGNINE